MLRQIFGRIFFLSVDKIVSLVYNIIIELSRTIAWYYAERSYHEESPGSIGQDNG
jgi:hypothetical protein